MGLVRGRHVAHLHAEGGRHVPRRHRRSTPRPSATTSTAGTTGRASPRARRCRTTTASCSAATPRRRTPRSTSRARPTATTRSRSSSTSRSPASSPRSRCPRSRCRARRRSRSTTPTASAAPKRRPTLSEYGTGHPTGTGPYKFDEWAPGEQLTLSAYEDYWGDAGQIDEIIFRVIDDPTARRQALESGSIDGYDLVGPADTGALEDAGFTMVSRAPFTILYLGVQPGRPGAAGLRSARGARRTRSTRTRSSRRCSPRAPRRRRSSCRMSSTAGTRTSRRTSTTPRRRKALLAEAGYTEANPLTLDVQLPGRRLPPVHAGPRSRSSRCSRRSSPRSASRSNPVTDAWSPDYLDRITGTPDHGIHLLGWTGDYNDTDNFVGVFFGQQSAEWGFDNPELFAALDEARGVAEPRGADGALRGHQRDGRGVHPGRAPGAPGPDAGVRAARRELPGQPGQRRGLQPTSS